MTARRAAAPLPDEAASRIALARIRAARGISELDSAIVAMLGEPMNRRELLQSAGMALVTPAVAALNAEGQRTEPAPDDRSVWVGTVRRLADPVLNNLANGTLRMRMPVEQAAGATNRPSVTHLEAVGRLMAGIAPWLELGAGRVGGRAASRPLCGPGPASDRPGRRSGLARFSQFHAQSAATGGRRVPGAGPAPRAAPASREAGFPDGHAPGGGAGVHARDHSGVQQLAAVFRDGRSRALRAGRAGRRDARGLRAAPARPVVQGRRGVRRRPGVPLGLLQQLRHPSDAAGRPRRLPRQGDGVEGAGRPGRGTRAPLRRRPGTARSRRTEASRRSVARSRTAAARFNLLAQMALRRSLPQDVTAPQVRGALTAVIRRTLEAPGDVRRQRMAPHRLLRPSAGGGGVVHFNR